MESDTTETEVVAEREETGITIGEALRRHMADSDEVNLDEDNTSYEPEPELEEEPATEEPQQVVTETPSALAPPADMRAEEKQAFLNPSPENAHILQNYINRRAYETRADYARKTHELEQQRQSVAGLLDVVKQHENDYAREGISLADVTRRSIAWDRAMQADPVNTALDWLDSYGLSVNDLMNGQAPAAPQQQQPVDYERIVEEKFQALQQQQQEKAVELFNQQVVNSFVSSKPLFKDPETASQLEAEMAPVVAALKSTGRYTDPSQILETAYSYVVNGNPTFSGLASKMAAKQDIQKTQQATQKAKQAAKSISGSAGSGTPRIVTKDLRANLERRMKGL